MIDHNALTTFCKTLAVVASLSLSVLAKEISPVQIGEGGRLTYATDEQGNRLPDFSHCGYRGGDQDPPTPSATIYLEPQTGDNQHALQAAIDQISSQPPNADGLRGCLQLASGVFRVSGQLRITASGVVVRGAGADPSGTTIVATGAGRRPLILVGSQEYQPAPTGEVVDIVDDHVPVGAMRVRLASGHGLQPGDRVVVTRRSTPAWIDELGARAPGVGWREGRCDIQWDRIVREVDDAEVTLDAPLTMAIDKSVGPGTVAVIEQQGRQSQVGIEDLVLRSEYRAGHPKDEDHSWFGVVANNVEDLWLRRLCFEHFAGGAILLRGGTKWVTAEDCLSLAPVSEMGGSRRHTFFTLGQQTLFLRCHSESGRHDFAAGHCAAGPNAFVQCYAKDAAADSGPLESWASGVLYDNVRIDGSDLFLGNRWTEPPGAGWSAANCVLWQCQAARIRAFRPPTADNWVLGYWAEPQGDANFVGQSEFLRPTSLFQAQLSDRRGEQAARRVEPTLLDPIASTNPTVNEAREFVAASNKPGRTLRDVIEAQMSASGEAIRAGLSSESMSPVEASPPTTDSAPTRRTIKIVNGWITLDGRVLTGGAINPTWWRGTVRAQDAAEFGPSITRFAPGRYGVGLTDDLDQVVEEMGRRDQVVYDHHYGLWYDRRRDDHLMVRRGTGEVAPPFFEQPFARSGTGVAWDGLSRYDLTQYNTWYWRRLADFAERCDRQGMVLFHQHYFQHNILEAGAHWADCPWRSANNINDTGFPEPPPYVGDKRIFIAHQFYDTANAKRADLHRNYIRKCLDNTASMRNVIHSIGAEYTGPLDFTTFWLQELMDWSRQQQVRPIVALATTKDVQDAVLADSLLAPAVDVIDIRYWCYDRDGKLYAPQGGVNLAPRQQFRKLQPEPADFRSIAQAVGEMRRKYPSKAVTYFAEMYCRSPREGWAVLMAGGSLAAVPPLPESLERAIPRMQPVESESASLLRLEQPGKHYLIYIVDSTEQIEIDLPENSQGYELNWISPGQGTVAEKAAVSNGSLKLDVVQPVLWIRAK